MQENCVHSQATKFIMYIGINVHRCQPQEIKQDKKIVNMKQGKFPNPPYLSE